MTREEAVNELNDRIKSAEYVDSDYIDCVSVDAVKMAISALSVPETNVGDTISRQAASDALNTIRVSKNETWYSCYQKVLDVFSKLPSAEPDIVRCKNCTWRLGTDCTRFAEVPVTPEDYCSSGKKK